MKRMQPDNLGEHLKHTIKSAFGCDVVLQTNEERARYYKCKKKKIKKSLQALRGKMLSTSTFSSIQ